jgi:hypothetical protein
VDCADCILSFDLLNIPSFPSKINNNLPFLISADTASREFQSTDKIIPKSINVPAEKNMIDIDIIRPFGPYIDKELSKNVTALIGKTAYLNCRVKNLSNKTVSVFVNTYIHMQKQQKKLFYETEIFQI